MRRRSGRRTGFTIGGGWGSVTSPISPRISQSPFAAIPSNACARNPRPTACFCSSLSNPVCSVQTLTGLTASLVAIALCRSWRQKMTGDYRIGFKRPPQSTRFRKGQSGNPKGRPKTSSLKSDLAKQLTKRITLTVRGRKTTMTIQQAVVIALTTNAVKGDARSATIIFNLIKQMLEPDTEESDLGSMSSIDKDIIESFLQRQLGTPKTGERK